MDFSGHPEKVWEGGLDSGRCPASQCVSCYPVRGRGAGPEADEVGVSAPRYAGHQCPGRDGNRYEAARDSAAVVTRPTGGDPGEGEEHIIWASTVTGGSISPSGRISVAEGDSQRFVI